MPCRFVARLLAVLFVGAIAASAHAQTAAPAGSPDRAAIEKIVRDYLLRHPEVLVEAMAELNKRMLRQAVTENSQQIFQDPQSPSAGNPKGDVTIVEFFDYHCGYCKQVHEPLLQALREDGNLRIVFKELPILAPESRVAAAAALAANRQGKYVEFHNALMGARGRLGKDRVLAMAREHKLDVDRLERDMDSSDIQSAIEANLQLAAALKIEGTPAFVVGDQIVPGALDIDQIRELIAEARAR